MMDTVKRIRVFLLATVLLLAAAGCQHQQSQGQSGAEGSESPADESTTQISAEATENDFCLKLFADKDTYRSDEAIQIWATLEYVGDEDTITIWHGEPYVVFSITDGADFNTGGVVEDILTSTELQKGRQYHFDYVKSGGYDATAPDADFWNQFYQEEALKLPAGTYTVSVAGAFYLSKELLSTEQGPSCELQITVQ